MAQIREIKVAFTDYRADLTLDVGFEGDIPMDAPIMALPEVVNITISNRDKKKSHRVIFIPHLMMILS